VSEQLSTPDRGPRAEHESYGGGSLAATISNRMVQILRHYSGRGPTRARTTVGRDHVLVVFHDLLTPSEKTLHAHGRTDLVLQSRRAMQEAMREDAVGMVEALTGRRVEGFLSDNHLDPDLGAEIFVLERVADGAKVSEADADQLE
jgi:uncharacterized protein YbcI